MKFLLFYLLISLLKPDTLEITSPVFKSEGMIPVKYTCVGENINPAIHISKYPPGTKSLALIVDDPDATSGTFVHWVAWNILPTNKIEENSKPGISGQNGAGENMYKGPCPPSGIHRYFFKVYALDAKLDLKPGSDKIALEKAMEKHILAKGELIGKFQKPS